MLAQDVPALNELRRYAKGLRAFNKAIGSILLTSGRNAENNKHQIKTEGGGRQHPSRRTGDGAPRYLTKVLMRPSRRTGDGAPRYLTKVLTPHGQASKTPEQTQRAPPRPVAWLCRGPSVLPLGLNETLGRGAPDGCRRPGHHQPLGVSLTLSLWRSRTCPGGELPVATRAWGRLWG